MNRLQQDLKCCGTKTDVRLGNGTYLNVDHPWNMWFAAYSLDDTYPNAIRELYSLPWSCCNLTRHSKCEHIGVSRYLRTFDTPTDFDDVEKALDVIRLNWNPTTFDHYLDRNEVAIATLYNSDCVVELLQRLITQVEITRTRMQRAGCSLTTCHNACLLAAAGVRDASSTVCYKN
uniref:ORF4 n=1 Tax=Angiostrongylus cantonensis TaxID=6313 RepID=A0A0K0DD81_ANGCA